MDPTTVPNNDPNNAVVNAGDATTEEAALIAAGTEVGADGAPIDAQAAQAAADAAAAAEAQAKADADAAAASARAADEAARAAAAPAATAAAPAALVLPPKPEAPKDFTAERSSLKDLYEKGDLDQDEYLEKREALTIEEAAYTGRLAAWETTAAAAKTTAAANAEAEFNTVALDWEKRNADFIANPIRAEAMQKLVDQIDKENNFALSPAELFTRAEKLAFEAFNYQPATPAPASGKTPEQIAAEALAARKPDTSKVPGTLATAPQAASLDPNHASYAAIDNLGIDDLENTLARMTPEQQAKYLADAPGATATGSE
jgi:hypothetical protein